MPTATAKAFSSSGCASELTSRRRNIPLNAGHFGALARPQRVSAESGQQISIGAIAGRGCRQPVSNDFWKIFHWLYSSRAYLSPDRILLLRERLNFRFLRQMFADIHLQIPHICVERFFCLTATHAALCQAIQDVLAQ